MVGAIAASVATLLQILGLPLVMLGGHLADRYGLVKMNHWGNLTLLLVMPLALRIGQGGRIVRIAREDLTEMVEQAA